MNREYVKWYSPHLQREMEMLVFGHSGARVLFFPTRTARFFDYENWRVIESMRGTIEAGNIQVFCVDSIDQESFYCWWAHPQGRVARHYAYENYIMEEVLPFMDSKNNSGFTISAGCSMGAYHAMNTGLRFPNKFNKIVAMSGRYDLTTPMGVFKDLLDGYRGSDVYHCMPNYYLPHVPESDYLRELQQLEVTMAIGGEDAFLGDNYFLSHALGTKGIRNHLHVWEGEAHKAYYWRRMVKHYL